MMELVLSNRHGIYLVKRHAVPLPNRYKVQLTALAGFSSRHAGVGEISLSSRHAGGAHNRYTIVTLFSGTKSILLKKSAVVNSRYQIVIIEQIFD